jgi:serine phosphatase RsbU (regulator of sigma subunit)
MIKVLDQLKGSNTETLVKGMMRSIDEFVGEADQADDLTMLAIRIK